MWVDRVTDAEDHLTDLATAQARAPLADIGSILIVVRSGILVRRLPIAIVDRTVSFNQDIKALLPDKTKLLPEYLWRFLQSREQEVLVCGVKKGATVHSVKSGYIEDMELPVPDLREQARIVELLDQADALRSQRAEADAKLARLLPSLFRHHFGDPLADQPETSLREVLTELKNGTTTAQNEDGKGYRVTRIETISAGTIDLTRTRFAEIDNEDLPAWRLTEGDILFSHINSETHLGKTALVPALAEPLIHGMNLLLLRPDRSKVTPEFLHTLLCTPSARAFWRTRCRRAVNQASINQGDLTALKFHRPTLEKQIEFTRQATQVSQALAQAAASAERLKTLFQTLLHRAFTGELTARWREAHLREGMQQLSKLSRA